jgi:hypothetical protein
MPRKKFAQCIGCGYCCQKVQCVPSLEVHGPSEGVCPSLQWDGTRHFCGLMRRPDPQGAQYRARLSAGAGCSSSMNSWRQEPLKDRRN